MVSTEQLMGPGSRVRHPAYGEGVVIRLHPVAYEVCFIAYGLKQVGKEYSQWEVIEQIPAEESVTYTDAERSLMKILRAWGEISETVKLGDKWTGGTLILKPGEAGLKDKEMPIEAFFHKIVMTRDRLRVMEQRINASPLSDEEKVNLQQYITKIYGSLTSFNILFKNKEDHFVGEKS
ncbi:MAG: hypothetical protein J5I41_09775 [Saprospiraceae bacterium]|nr:hypothetical protein [Saprospiraceae bacterium]